MRELINNHKVIICMGTGGVGKTTLSSVIGLTAASTGKRVLIITIDPARRLAQALGIKNNNEITQVNVPNLHGELYAGMLTAEKTFKRYIYSASKTKEDAEKIIKNKLYKQLSSKLSGSQEFTSMLELLELYQSKKYDLIILDTPPSQHAIDFLKAPKKIYHLFQNQITAWFANSGKKNSFISKVFQQSTQMVLGIFERVTGDVFIQELADFFKSLHALQDSIQKNSFDSDQLLHSKETAFVLISSNDPVKVSEAKRLHQNLLDEGYDLSAYFVNQAFPHWMKGEKPQINIENANSDVQQYYKMWEYYSHRSQKYVKFFKDNPDQFELYQVPQFDRDLSGLNGLEFLSSYLKKEYMGESKI